MIQRIKKAAITGLSLGAVVLAGLVPTQRAYADPVELEKLLAERERIELVSEMKQPVEGTEVDAETEASERLRTGSLRWDYVMGGKDTSFSKSEISMGPGTNDPSDPWARFYETFRIRLTNGKKDGREIDSTDVAVNLPIGKQEEDTVNGLGSRLLLYGSKSSSEESEEPNRRIDSGGMGAEFIFSKPKWTAAVSASRRTDEIKENVSKQLVVPAELAGEYTEGEPLVIDYTERELTRERFTQIGAYADRELGPVVVGAGIDFINTPDGDITHYLGKVRWYPKGKREDQFGLAFRLTDEADDTRTNNLTGIYGKWTGPIGGRILTNYIWNPDRDTSTFSLQTFVAQNPALAKQFPFAWTTHPFVVDTGMYSTNVIPNALEIDGIHPSQRSNKGLTAQVDVSQNDTEGVVDGSARLTLAYMQPLGKSNAVGLSVFGEHNYTKNSEEPGKEDKFGASVYTHSKQWEFIVGAEKSRGDNPDTRVHINARRNFSIPNIGKKYKTMRGGKKGRQN